MTELSEMQYAGFWRRTFAVIIDSFLLAILVAMTFGGQYVNAAFFSLEGVVVNVFTVAVTVLLWLTFLGTPGKLMMGCQVVDEKTFEALSAKQALIRYASYYISIFTLFLGFISIAWDKRKQGFHDRIAKTVVVYDGHLAEDDESQKTLERLMAEAA